MRGCDAVQVLNAEDTLRSWPLMICPPLGKSLLRLKLRNFCKRQLPIPSIPVVEASMPDLLHEHLILCLSLPIDRVADVQPESRIPRV